MPRICLDLGPGTELWCSARDRYQLIRDIALDIAASCTDSEYFEMLLADVKTACMYWGFLQRHWTDDVRPEPEWTNSGTALMEVLTHLDQLSDTWVLDRERAAPPSPY